MADFKKLTDKEIAALDPTAQAKYAADLDAYEAEQDKSKAEANKKAKSEAKASTSEYLGTKEIEELKANNPTLKEFFVTSDKTPFPNVWLAENHNKNRESDDAIQHIKK